MESESPHAATVSPPNAPQEHVHIVGGGIVGAATAYYLSKRGIKSTIIERRGIACSASGKAGGFLGGGWGDHVTAELHLKGFDLHKQLAKDLGIASFREIHTLQASPAGRQRRGTLDGQPSWIDSSTTCTSMMDTDTAQVTPLELTTKLVESSGCQVLIGAVESAKLSVDGSSVELNVNGEVIVATKVVFCTGPWAVQLEDWFGVQVPMEGIWSSSAVFEPAKSLQDPAALFCHEDENGCHLEIYPRPNNEVYVCGIGGSRHVQPQELRTLLPESVQPVASRVGAACKSLDRMTIGLQDDAGKLEPVITQACMRPCPADGRPMIGKVYTGCDESNVFMAAGHNCWGILWGPVTGLAMSELVATGESTTVDLSAYDPMRFTNKQQIAKIEQNRGRKQNTTQVGEQW